MKTVIKYSSLLLSMTFLALIVFGVVSVADAMALFGASGTTYALAIAGGVTTQNIYNSEVLDNPYEQMMTVMKPDDYPLDQIVRNMKKSYSWDAWKVTHPDVETRPFSDTLSAASTATSGDTAGDTTTFVVTNGAQWIVDDLVRVHGTNGANGKPLTAQVVAKTGNSLTVMAINGTGTLENTIPIIAINSVVSRVGNAKSETAAQNGIYNAVPSTDYNFMQIHMGQIEESEIYKRHAKNIKYDKALQKLLAMYNFRNEAEANALFGMRRMKADPQSSETKYFSGGAEYFIENDYHYGSATAKTTFTEKNWIDITKNVFTGNSGSSTRYMFAGKELIARIASIEGISKQLKANESSEIIWGVTFSKVKTDFGILNIKYHKMFDYYGYADKGMVLDLTNVDKYVMEPFQKTAMEYNKTGQKRVDSERFHETSCFAFKYKDTHSLITPTP